MSTHTTQYIPLACLVALFLDTVSTWRIEYRVVWRQRKGLIPAIYLWARYGGLAVLIAHNILAQIILPRCTPLTIRQCSIWFSTVVALCCSFSLALETILALRVYALYGKTNKIWLLLLPAGIQYGCFVLFVYLWVLKPGAFPGFDSTCGLRIKVIEGLVHALTTLVFHGFLWGATLAKRRLAGAAPSSRVNRSIVRWVAREGTMVFGLMVLIVTVAGPAMSVSKTIRLDLVFVVPITFISLTTSRLILNMRTPNFQRDLCSTESQEPPQISSILQSYGAALDGLP